AVGTSAVQAPSPSASATPPAGPLPRGPLAFVSDEGSGAVSVLDATTGKEISTFHVGKRPRGIQRSPDGSRVFVALSGTAAAPPGATGALPAPDPAAHGIGVIDARTLAIGERLSAGSDPEQFALSRDGTKIYVLNEDAETATVIDIDGRRGEATIKVGEEPEGVAASPD